MMADDTRNPPPPSVCEQVLEGVAATSDVPPDRIEPPLFDVVDPDALDALFEGRDGNHGQFPARVEFALGGCRVVVSSTGRIGVSPLTAEGRGGTET